MGERQCGREKDRERDCYQRIPFSIVLERPRGISFEKTACLGLSLDLCIVERMSTLLLLFFFKKKSKVILGVLGASVARSLTLEKTACINML